MATYKPKKKIDNNGTLDDIKFPMDSIYGLSDEFKKKGVHFISDSDITVTSGSASLSEKWVVNGVDGITEPFDGMLLAIRTPSRGLSSKGVVLSIDGGNNYNSLIIIDYAGVSSFNYAYRNQTTILFSFNAVQSTSAYLESGVATTITGCWQTADKDNNYIVNQYKNNEDNEKPILTKYSNSTSDSTGPTSFSQNVTINHAKGRLSATELRENGVSLADKYALKGESGGNCFENLGNIDTWAGIPNNVEVLGSDGVTWDEEYVFYDKDENVIASGNMAHRIPLQAGEGIEFIPDTENNVVKINATGGSGGGIGGSTTSLFSEWTTGTSGNLYLPSAGLYEIKVVVLEYNEPRTMTFFVDWEVSSYSYSQATLYEVGGNDSSSIIIVDDTGLIEYYNNDYNSDKVQSISYRKVNEQISAGGSSGGGTPFVETTYNELKALRDGGQLVAGQKYRITDYNCTTTQENTTSAMHQFDIIVEALSNNTLSENASAIQHGGSGSGGGSPQFKPEVLADSDGTLVEGAIVASYYYFEDFNESTGEQEGYKSMDEFIAYTYLENNDGVVVPVIYKTDADGAINAPEEFDYPDTEDTFFYDGTMEVDGTTYDKWRKIELGGDTLTWDGDAKVWALTNVVVTSGGSASDPYFANCKLSAWEIKYSLDNDKTRFWWAMDATPAWFTSNFDVGTWYATGETYEHDGATYYVFFNEGVSTLYSTTPYPTKPNEIYIDFDGSGTLEDDNSVINEYGGGEEGKGVIYYMKDEYGNECPYDFKNIQFDREGTYYYTFSWVDENNAVKDLSIVGNTELYNDEGGIAGCYGNKMGIVSLYDFGVSDDNPTNLATALNDNVFISTYSYDDGFCYGCYNNTFGDGCGSNTFGDSCFGNTFGDSCFDNTFGDKCHFNTFGDACYLNTFGNNCYYNTFGNGSNSSTLGNSCFGNTFGNDCFWCIFGDDCCKNIVDNGVLGAHPQPTTGTGTMQGIHIHYGVTGRFTVTRGANYTQDVRTANDVTITV